jgi:hypothetical protein
VNETATTDLTQRTGIDRMRIETRLNRGIKMIYGAIAQSAQFARFAHLARCVRRTFSSRCAPAEFTLAARRTLYLHTRSGAELQLKRVAAVCASPAIR